MEPPTEILSSLWNFIKFLPFFFGLLVLGTIKGECFQIFLLVNFAFLLW